MFHKKNTQGSDKQYISNNSPDLTFGMLQNIFSKVYVIYIYIYIFFLKTIETARDLGVA